MIEGDILDEGHGGDMERLCDLELFTSIMMEFIWWWCCAIEVIYVNILRTWWYDDCDEMSLLYALWDHVKGMLIQS